MSETKDYISVCIDNILLGLHSSSYKPSIFRVPDELRCENEKLYEPKVLAVGRYHHNKNRLRKMEQHKFQYLKLLLDRRNESSADKYVKKIKSLEEKARGCYAEPIDHLSSDDFVQMLLLDGIFIIELIRKYWVRELFRQGLSWLRHDLRDDTIFQPETVPSQLRHFLRDDTIFQHEQLLSQLRHDLMLVENQVPFFILDELFSMTKSGHEDDNILYLIPHFIDAISPWPDASILSRRIDKEKIDHLLGLVHKIWCSSFAGTSGPDKAEDRIWCSPSIWCSFFAKMTASRFVKAEKEQKNFHQ